MNIASMTLFAFPRVLCVLLASCLLAPYLFAGDDDDVEVKEDKNVLRSVWDIVLEGSKGDVFELLNNQPELLNYRVNGGKSTLLHLAAFRGDADILNLIIACMGDKARRKVLAGCDCEWTPLHIAVDQGHLGVAAILMREAVMYLGGVADDDEDRSITPFYLAALHGNVPMLWAFYAAGYPVDVRALNGATLLHAAAQEGHEDAVRALLAMRDVAYLDLEEMRDDDGWTPLHAAALNGREGVVRLLIEAQVDPNARTTTGFTAVDFALMRGHHHIAGIIETYRAQYQDEDSDSSSDEDSDDCSMRESSRDYAAELACAYGVELARSQTEDGAFSQDGFSLFVAAMAGDEVVVASYVDAETIEPEALIAALQVAAAFGHEGVVSLLLRAGVNIDDASGPGGRTVLHLAAQGGHVNAVRCLVAAGADPYAADEEGRTALHIAVENRDSEMLHCLIEVMQNINGRAFDLDLEDVDGETPLDWAMREYERDPGDEAVESIIALLLYHGANLNYVDEDGRTYWHWAVERGWEGLLRVFIGTMGDARPDLYFDWEDNGGWTPFQEAIRLGDVEMMRLLAHAGARLDCPQEALDDLPEHVVQIWEALREEFLYRAVHGVNVLGFSPLHRAVAAGDWEKVWWLLSEGAQIDESDADGFTPLHIAALQGLEGIAELLLLWGADLHVLNGEGDSPRVLAARGGYVGIVDLINEAELGRLTEPVLNVDIPLQLRINDLFLGQPHPEAVINNPLVPAPNPRHGERVFYFNSF